jgi:hypothetical protein
MDKKILNKLFSKDELWYNENIHANLVSKILSALIDKKAEKTLEQDEYFVQGRINDFITGHLRNTQFSTKRENKSTDIAVILSDTEEPIILYEVKTYIKKHEIKINPKDIYKDILKLAIRKKEIPYINCYMLIAGKTKVSKDAFDNNGLKLPNKFDNTNNRTAIELTLDFFESQKIESKLLEKAKKLKIKEISISPSRWKNYDGMCAITWKINKIK